MVMAWQQHPVYKNVCRSYTRGSTFGTRPESRKIGWLNKKRQYYMPKHQAKHHFLIPFSGINETHPSYLVYISQLSQMEALGIVYIVNCLHTYFSMYNNSSFIMEILCRQKFILLQHPVASWLVDISHLRLFLFVAIQDRLMDQLLPILHAEHEFRTSWVEF